METPPAAEKPVVYIFHGDDTFAIKQSVEALLKQMGDPTIADLNTTRLDGRQANDDEMRSAANAMPFLAERRLVIVTNPFARLTTDATRKRFLTFLDALPPSTALILIVEDVLERGKWKSLPQVESNWMRKWLNHSTGRGLYRLCQLPTMNDMADWVRKEARRLGGQFSTEASTALVAHIGNDTRLASLEINKLLTYVDFKRAVQVEDVEEMTAQSGQTDIFGMVDALANGNTRQATTLLHRLLEEQDALSLFGMIVRQFRLLIQTREILDEGRGAQVASELRQAGFIADKLSSQARRFRMPQLEAIYHRLLLLDESIKTSQAPADLAFDIFIAELTQ